MVERRRCSTQQSADGSALIIVLAFAAVLILLLLALLGTSADGTRASVIAGANGDAESLARLPEQIVMAQLQRATTRTVSADGDALGWASQPGMIRVFGTGLAAGMTRPPTLMHYRLYSAPAMNTPALDLGLEAAALAGWSAKPAGYTDLNAPAVSTSAEGGTPALVYPIADPQAIGRVEGFALATAAPDASEVQPLPMPVAWIYVLRGGQLIVPTSTGGTTARFNSAALSPTNPIVGRIAFWTDDESCKLNLNTASEAAPWDMPAANTSAERAYALHPPGNSEVFRMAEHPAFTSLSPVLKTFGGASAGSVQWPVPEALAEGDPMLSAYQRYVACYQALAPHGADAGLAPRQDRHFASVDEFYYGPQRNLNGAGAGFLMERGDLNMARFFLTEHSAAPELNPFGGPKIALWMVPQAAAERTALDAKTALAATLNAGTDQAREFLFQRAANWADATHQGSSQSMTDDCLQVPRNRELYAWLQTLGDQPVPGFGGSFLDKYGARSRDEILTSMLDMLRWSTNTATGLPPSLGNRNTLGLAEQSAVPLSIDQTDGTPYTRGFGRFPTLTEVAVVFAFTDVERKTNGTPRDDNNDGICDRATKLRAFMVMNPFLPACGQPAPSPAWSVRIRRMQQWSLGAGISPLLPGGNVRNRWSLSGAQTLANGLAWGGNASPFASFAAQFTQASGAPKEIGKRDDPGRDFPFISQNDVTLQAGAGKPNTSLKFSGGRIIVDLMDPNASQTAPQLHDAIQSIELEFPQTQLPLPSLPVADFAGGPLRLDDRFRPVTVDGEQRLRLIRRGDVVRSMILNPNGPSHGDARLLAARRELFFPEAAAWFAPHPDYHTAAIAQSLRDGAYATTGQYGEPPQPTRTAAGTLLPNARYADNAIPAVPAGVNGAVIPALGNDPGSRLGDWESGAGSMEDGPLVNRCCILPGGSFTRGSFASESAQEPRSGFASGVGFGALPSGVYGDAADATPRPWQTLLFCPNPAGRQTPASTTGRFDDTVHDHFGFANPPDHLWLEFFAQPVTDPWPMTADFATEGKVNLNYQILPFTWLHRASALYGAMKGVRITAIPTTAMDDQGDSAKGGADGAPLTATFRYEVDAEKTVAGMARRFDSGEIFRSASEICEQFLVPKRIEGQVYNGEGFAPPDPAGISADDMTAWWNGDPANPADAFEATGDNLRESPYAQLYPRLCTQSNVFRVHYRVQVLKKARGTLPDEWDEERDSIVAERRGSSVVERRLARTDQPIPDPATNGAALSLHAKQTFRVVSRTAFQP